MSLDFSEEEYSPNPRNPRRRERSPALGCGLLGGLLLLLGLALVGVVTGIVLLGFRADRAGLNRAAAGPAVSVSSEELGAATLLNPAAATQKFEGKLLRVTGMVMKIEKSSEVGYVVYLGGVLAVFPTENEISRLTLFGEAEIEGVCEIAPRALKIDGQEVTAPVLRSCTVVEKKAEPPKKESGKKK